MARAEAAQDSGAVTADDAIRLLAAAFKFGRKRLAREAQTQLLKLAKDNDVDISPETVKAVVDRLFPILAKALDEAAGG